jgi:hypothetical protein
MRAGGSSRDSARVGERVAQTGRRRARWFFQAGEDVELQTQRRLRHDRDPCGRLIAAQCLAVEKQRIGHARHRIDVRGKFILPGLERGFRTVEAQRESRFADFEAFALHDNRSGDRERCGVLRPPGRTIIVIRQSRLRKAECNSDDGDTARRSFHQPKFQLSIRDPARSVNARGVL